MILILSNIKANLNTPLSIYIHPYVYHVFSHVMYDRQAILDSSIKTNVYFYIYIYLYIYILLIIFNILLLNCAQMMIQKRTALAAIQIKLLIYMLDIRT